MKLISPTLRWIRRRMISSKEHTKVIPLFDSPIANAEINAIHRINAYKISVKISVLNIVFIFGGDGNVNAVCNDGL